VAGRNRLWLCHVPCGKALPYRDVLLRNCREAKPRDKKLLGSIVGKAKPFRTDCGKAASETCRIPRWLCHIPCGKALPYRDVLLRNCREAKPRDKGFWGQYRKGKAFPHRLRQSRVRNWQSRVARGVRLNDLIRLSVTKTTVDRGPNDR